MMEAYEQAAKAIKNSKFTVAFTGAGISVESGIPPFRGKGGIWNKYDPNILDLDYYINHTAEVWTFVKKMLYEEFAGAKPNIAHYFLAELEKQNLLQSIITQNIDNLHFEAGSKNVIEFHGNSSKFICLGCQKKEDLKNIDLSQNPPKCKHCGGLLKPDVVFFGEGIPTQAYQKSIEMAEKAEVFLIIGTSGQVYPAAYIPTIAKQSNATIIEINLEPSFYTDNITDIFLQGKATKVSEELKKFLLNL